MAALGLAPTIGRTQLSTVAGTVGASRSRHVVSLTRMRSQPTESQISNVEGTGRNSAEGMLGSSEGDVAS